jgi:L-2-hydroxycarboxylate dehydrogenase (NAD+)
MEKIYKQKLTCISSTFPFILPTQKILIAVRMTGVSNILTIETCGARICDRKSEINVKPVMPHDNSKNKNKVIMKIKINELENLITKALRTEYSQEETNLIKDVVLFGELSGKLSHGILRLLRENYGVFTDTIQGKPEYIRKTKVSTLIDGKGNVGMLVGSLAMQEVIQLGKANGIGIVGTKGSINTTGSLSYNCEKIAKENLIGIIFTHCTPMMAPFSSKKALFGTNPLAFGIPSIPQPIIFDMSTSAITFGTMAKYKAEGKELPPNVAIDKEGNLTRDASQAIDGATLAFDNSYKGSGLAMMVEILGQYGQERHLQE